jgi:hypothetical protein
MPTHADPPLGGLQVAASRFRLHLVTPLALVRQQVTAPGLPHVERATQRLAAPKQSAGSVPASTAADSC